MDKEKADEIKQGIEDSKSSLNSKIEEVRESIQSKPDRDAISDIRTEMDDRTDELFQKIEGKAEKDTIQSIEEQIGDRASQKALESLKKDVYGKVDEDEIQEINTKILEINQELDIIFDQVDEIDSKIGEEKMGSGKLQSLEERLNSLERGEIGNKDINSELEEIKSKVRTSSSTEQVQTLEERISDIEKILRKTPGKDEFENLQQSVEQMQRSFIDNKENQVSGSMELETLNPAQVDRSCIGEVRRVEGELELRSEVSGYFLYTLEGTEDVIIVKSSEKIPEGENTVQGVVKELDRAENQLYINLNGN